MGWRVDHHYDQDRRQARRLSLAGLGRAGRARRTVRAALLLAFTAIVLILMFSRPAARLVFG